MTNDDFFEALEPIVKAPEGVKTLRGLILELAASAELISAQEDVELYRLGDLVEFNRGGLVQAVEIPSGAWVLDLEDVEKDTGRILDHVSLEERATTSAKAQFRSGDVLYGKLRPYLNKVVVADADGCCTTEIIVLTPDERMLPSYLSIVLRSPRFVEWANSVTHGVKMPRLGTRLLSEAQVPVVSRSQQDRIVKRVDELMAMFDRLESEQERAEELRLATAKSTFAAIVESATADRSEALRLLGENLEGVLQPGTNAPAVVDELRRTIRRLAFSGSLSAEGTVDGKAEVRGLLSGLKSDALDEGRSQRRRKRHSQVDAPPDRSDFVGMPDDWELVRLADVANVVRGVSYSKDEVSSAPTPGSIPVLRANNIQTSLVLSGLVYVRAHRISESQLAEPGDIVICLSSGSASLVGKSAIVGSDASGYSIGAFCALIKPLAFASYLAAAFQSGVMTEQLVGAGRGIGINNLRIEDLRSAVVPIPPTREQSRLVSMVGALISDCDELAHALSEERELARALGESVSDSLRT